MRRGATGGGLVLSGSVFAALAGRADAAVPPDNDLAYLRLLVGAELLAADFQAKALASEKLSRHSKTPPMRVPARLASARSRSRRLSRVSGVIS